MVQSLLSRNEKAQGDVTNVYLVGGNEEEGSRLFSVVPHDRTRGTVYRIKQMKFHLHTAKPLFTVRVVRHGNSLLRELVESLTVVQNRTGLSSGQPVLNDPV